MALPTRTAIVAVLSLLASVLVPAGVAVAVPPPATVAAASLPSLLTARADDTAHPYSRDRFQLWIDADGNGCDTRAEVLIQESTTPVTIGARCALTGGTWLSPYDGAAWTAPSDVDIDHVVPLAEAWRSGAWSWTDAQRRDYANDLGVPYALIAVTDNVNQSKGDKDPAQWMPPLAGFACDYAIDWALVKYRWSLTADTAELAKLGSVLSGDCGDRQVTLPAQLVSATAPVTQTVIAGFPNGTTRLAGADRYATAIAASKRYSPNVPVVFIASGTTFPDALSAAAAAAKLGGPLLLTPSASLPAAVLAEVERLAPARIYVAGGPSAVSDRVLASLSAVAPATRLGGSDRYATGLRIVSEAFPSAATAFIASGRTFPDALAASGAAGAGQAPVILVDGTRPSVTAQTLTALGGLGVGRVAIAGSAAVVSSGIEAQLRSQGYTVTRYGGSDRYATAALINRAFFPAGSSANVFLANGLGFADALAGAALAGRLSAPLFITQAACVPAAVHDAIADLGAAKKVVLGSTAVVGAAAASNTKCAPPPSKPAPPAPPKPTPPTKPANPGDTKNCSDFKTWAEANAWYKKYFPYYGDIAKLDGDHDGIPCETLPGHP